jgi:hypothetical protein
MNPRETTVLAFWFLAAISPVAAQSPAPGPSPGPSSAVAPSKEATKAPVRANRSVGPDADARGCLEFATNLEIILCAEKYLPRRRDG